ncbi:MAG: serine/threonine protein kinase, partial [Bacteroidetes bacterium]|nr:serine/threonine protein kinase [Bacteroidota bacterium]
NPGDCFYIFTDGFADQFGGPKGKKYKYKPFKRLLVGNVARPMAEQLDLLNDAIEEWKGYTNPLHGEPYEQVDDICVIGVRI